MAMILNLCIIVYNYTNTVEICISVIMHKNGVSATIIPNENKKESLVKKKSKAVPMLHQVPCYEDITLP